MTWVVLRWINATPGRVRAVYVDPTRIPDWRTGRPSVVSVRGQPGVPGSSYVSTRSCGRDDDRGDEAPRRLTPGSRPTSAWPWRSLRGLSKGRAAPTYRFVQSPTGADVGSHRHRRRDGHPQPRRSSEGSEQPQGAAPAANQLITRTRPRARAAPSPRPAPRPDVTSDSAARRAFPRERPLLPRGGRR